MENVKLINKYLKEHYGCSLSGRPRFRLVWSDGLTEARKGIHHEFAVFETVEEKPKYNYISERWILEIDTLAYQDIFGRAIRERESIVKRGDGYEPLRVFQNRKGEYLKPNLDVCKIICDAWVSLVNRPEGQRLTRKQASASDAEKMRAEAKKFEELLGADDSDLIQKFRDGEAVIIHRGA